MNWYDTLNICFENSFRWFINKEGGNSGSLKNVRTSSILPVDLNALIYMDYMAISEFFSLLGDSAKSEEFSQKAAKLKVYFLENKLQKIFILLRSVKVEIILEQREVAFLSLSKIWENLNFSTKIQIFANFAGWQ